MTHINYVIHISWPQEEFVNQPGTKSTTFGSADQAVKSTDLEEGRGTVMGRNSTQLIPPQIFVVVVLKRYANYQIDIKRPDVETSSNSKSW